MPDNHQLVMQWTIGASASDLYSALTTLEGLKSWLGPGSCHVEGGFVDLHEGKNFCLQMAVADVGTVTLSGTYDRLIPNKCAAFTWNWGRPFEPGESHVTISLAETTGGTALRIDHTNFATADERDRHIDGWHGSLQKLRDTFQPHLDHECAASVDRTPGLIQWRELLTHDVASAASFYNRLFDWDAQEMPMPDGSYYIFSCDGQPVAGMMPILPEWGDMPSQWLTYVTVRDIEQSVQAAQAAGATTLQPPKEVPGMGSLAILRDSGDAVFACWEFSKS